METLAARKAYGFGPDAAKPTAHIIDSAGWNSLLAARQRAQICVTAALAVITLGLNYSAVFTDPLATMRVITLSRPIGHNPGLTGRLLVSLCLLLLPLLGQAQSVAVTHCQGECPRYSSQPASSGARRPPRPPSRSPASVRQAPPKTAQDVDPPLPGAARG